MSTPVIYEASIYTQEVHYKNYNGENKVVQLHFALDPMALLSVFAGIPIKKVRSGNPAINGTEAGFTDEQQLKMVTDLARKAAGSKSDDGESWIPFEDFADSIAGKTFLTKLATSDSIRREFSERVILDPFRAFINYFSEDPSNSQKEIQEMKTMLAKMEKLFATPEPGSESSDDRRARLAKELAELESNDTATE